MGEPLKVGVVGTGTISAAYFDTLAGLSGVEVVAVADLDLSKASQVGDARGVQALELDELYKSDVEAVLNLTIPAAHAEVALKAVAEGKHVYGEKPLAATLADARAVLDAAKTAGVRVGCAPDTVLGTGIQTARALLDRGDIGVPTAASAFFTCPGHELWHPAPEFYYRAGGGPWFDMGPYYVTALVTLLGPVTSVTGKTGRALPERKVHTGERAGTAFPVEVDTHVTGVLEHANGALSTVTMSFDVWGARLPRIEVYGTAGSLAVPDPNGFDGQVDICTPDRRDWSAVPVAGGYAGAGRGVGLADLARAVRTGEPHRASGELAFHVLDVLESLLASAASGHALEVASTVQRPAPVVAGSTPELA